MSPRVKSRPPKCKDCGSGSPRVVSIAVEVDGKKRYRHEWLCATCEWKRSHPDEPARPKLPSERRALPLQRETLF